MSQKIYQQGTKNDCWLASVTELLFNNSTKIICLGIAIYSLIISPSVKASEESRETPSPPIEPAIIDLPTPESSQIDPLRLVIRLSDRRVYVYEGENLKTSYPIAVGKQGWETPTGTYEVLNMQQNPAWEHPWTGEVIAPGPNNPLGLRWIGFWTDGKNYIGFHGTPNEASVGQAASHGCIRMYNQDILALYTLVSVGTPVIVEP